VLPNTVPFHDRNAAEVAVIQSEIGSQPCHSVARWDAQDATTVTKDGIHPSDGALALYAVGGSPRSRGLQS
jgi:hypothetical protein